MTFFLSIRNRASNIKAYFSRDEANIPYSAGPIEFWRGIFQFCFFSSVLILQCIDYVILLISSVRPSPAKMILTIDTCMAAM